MDYGIVPAPPLKKRKYELFEKIKIELVNWNGYDFDVRQIIQAYDVKNRCRTGLIVTETSAKDLLRRTRNYKKYPMYRGDLYIKARNSKDGLFEMTLVNTHIKQMDADTIWFNHEGYSSLRILEKPKQ